LIKSWHSRLCSIPSQQFAPDISHLVAAGTYLMKFSCLILAKNRFKQPFEISSAAFVHAGSNARTITALRSPGVLEDGMEHHAQILLALFISSALCLAAWIWARHRLARLSGERR
jgi:hypothetical protein